MKTEDCKHLSGFLFLPACKHCTKCLAGSLAYWPPLSVCPLWLTGHPCQCVHFGLVYVCLYVHFGLLDAPDSVSTLAYLTPLSVCPLWLTWRPCQCVHFDARPAAAWWDGCQGYLPPPGLGLSSVGAHHHTMLKPAANHLNTILETVRRLQILHYPLLTDCKSGTTSMSTDCKFCPIWLSRDCKFWVCQLSTDCKFCISQLTACMPTDGKFCISQL